MDFALQSPFLPTGDQPEAIHALLRGLQTGHGLQTLLGVTGSGKTFTIANVLARLQMPTLVLSHNKTLAAQLYGEFKGFFPENAVEYFVSYYDYYQPEAYIPSTDTYIEKDLAINEEIDKLRLRTTASLLSGRRDVIVVSSVSCLYGMADPSAFAERVVHIKEGMKITRDRFLRQLVEALYVNDKVEFRHGRFRVAGDTVDVFPSIEGYEGVAYRIEFWGDEVERISSFDPRTGMTIDRQDRLNIYPTNLFVTTDRQIEHAMGLIEADLSARVEQLTALGKAQEAKRLYERVTFDMEMIRELGHCSGIENYSRYFDGRRPGERPFCLLDYFPEDFLMVVDESHVTIPQIRAMYGGDLARKRNLVEYGFRLPAALDNRPLRFEEFEAMTGKTIYVSATPAEYELVRSGGRVVDQVIRPTGLLDPDIEVRPTANQIDDLMEEIARRIDHGERTLVTTLTKRMAEELTDYLLRMGIRCTYIHSDVETLERVRIMEGLREGVYDVLVGVNLLREGLDLPEVSLVAVLDADKEGFLRSRRSLTQTAGRAARNVHGAVIFYADKVTESMRRTMEETTRRREKQMAYNAAHGITPQPIVKGRASFLNTAAHGQTATHRIPDGEKIAQGLGVEELKKLMDEASARFDFLLAARYRDAIKNLE
ncbi:MAG: excinuclease ABC subunit UvrB [Tannerellaceae bacterium]|jgi:excinuclease ABC subunit B|nr:excinuclease ABC subunit UvrB [Tannerellaceae bacterium]